MSRFSKADAEAAGWVFTHESDESIETGSSTQGRVQITPAQLTAEKYVSFPGTDKTLITETAETTGKLLERIYEYESHLARVGAVQDNVPVAPVAPAEGQEVPPGGEQHSIGNDVVVLQPGETLEQARDRHSGVSSAPTPEPTATTLAPSATSPSPGPAAEDAIAAEAETGDEFLAGETPPAPADETGAVAAPATETPAEASAPTEAVAGDAGAGEPAPDVQPAAEVPTEPAPDNAEPEAAAATTEPTEDVPEQTDTQHSDVAPEPEPQPKTPEELQAEIDALKAQVAADEEAAKQA